MDRVALLVFLVVIYATGQAASAQDQPTTMGGDEAFGYGTAVRAGGYFGETYAEPDGFLAIDFLKPMHSALLENGDEHLSYLDARFAASFESGGVMNLGVGQRRYYAESDFILDGNLWYDLDRTRSRMFHQVTAGARFYNDFVSIRGHYYRPFGEDVKNAGFTPLTGNVGYTGNMLALERFRLISSAYEGFDAELGLKLGGPIDAELLIGFYDFSADKSPAVRGFTAAIQSRIFDEVHASAQVTVDDTESETFMFGIAYEFGSRASMSETTVRSRLGERTRRNRHVVSREAQVYAPLAAENVSGVPFNIVHASSGGNSSGTFESPYSNLASAAADAAAENSIVLVHADSVFDGQSVVLPEGVRFLGEGPDYSVVTRRLGQITLPRATQGTALPVIQNSPAGVPAITLGNNMEINSIRVANAHGTGILLDQLTGGLTYQDVAVDGAETGIHILGTTGVLNLDPIAVSNTTGDGLLVESTQDGASLTFSDVTISNAGTHGLRLSNSSENSRIEFAGNTTIDSTGAHGIDIEGGSDEAGTLFSGPVSISATGGSGLNLTNRNDDVVGLTNDIQFSNLMIDGAGGSAVRLINNGSNLLVDSLSVTNWQTTAFEVNNSEGNLTVSNPLALENTTGSEDPTIFLTGQLRDVKFSTVSITDTAAATGQPTVFLFESDTNVSEIAFDNLNIVSANRVALGGIETGSNLSKLTIGGGVITTTDASAIRLDGHSTDVTLDEVNVSNAEEGIHLTRVGPRTAFHDGFRILGGTMNNVQRGIVAVATDDLTASGMSIDSSEVGIRIASANLTQPQRATIQDVSLTDGGGSPSWIGIDIDWDRGAHFGDLSRLSGNAIAGTGNNQTGIRVRNVGSNLDMKLAIDNTTINLSGPTSTGLLFSATGILDAQVANFGGITLSGAGDNLVTVTGQPGIEQEQRGATVEGSILINGLAFP